MTTEIKPFTQAQLAQISDENLKRALLRRENVEPLEELLAAENERLNHLCQLERKGKIDLGGPVTRKEMQRIFREEIKGRVDECLDTDYMSSPKVEYFSLARTKLGRKILYKYLACAGLTLSAAMITPITIPFSALSFFVVFEKHKEKEAENFGCPAAYYKDTEEAIFQRGIKNKIFQPVAAHEYSHHVQSKALFRTGGYRIFKEGHAMGVEKHIANLLELSNKDPSFAKPIVPDFVIALATVYDWMSKELDFSPDKSLSDLLKYSLSYPNYTCLGTSIFSLAEARHGKGIYRDVLRGDFSSILGARE